MNRRELVTLKLQMGISPSAVVAPDILRAMWHQLKLERVNAQHNRARSMPQPSPVTTHSIRKQN